MTIAATRRPASDHREAGFWEGRSLWSYLAEAVRLKANAPALIQGDRRLDYAGLGELAARVHGGLRQLGARPGDVVMSQTPNWWEGVVTHHAVNRLGGVSNPVVPIYRHSELEFILRQARPRVAVVPHRFRGFDYVAMMEELCASLAAPPRVVVMRPEGRLPDGFVTFEEIASADPAVEEAVAPDDIALLLYTSGTTAEPKGVLHSHETLAWECRSIARLYELTDEDTIFMPSPITHMTGVLYGVLLPTLLRGKSVLMDRWEPSAAAQLIDREGCVFTVGATPFLQGLTDVLEGGSGCSLRVFACGGADVPPSLVERARNVLQAAVVRAYGSTEFPTVSAGRADDPPAVAAKTDGGLIPPTEVRLENEVDGVGELAVRGPELFLGYLDPRLNEGQFSNDGFFLTGDLASLEGDAVTIRGRKKDIIIRGGENISAKEVEDLLYRHPDVVEVAVVAMPDAAMGEKAAAFVVPVRGAEPTLQDLCVFLAEHRIARQKHPERLELREELPKTASGKLQKFRLRDEVRRLGGDERRAGSAT